MINYLLTSALCLLAFYLIFRLFLKAEKLMQLQRGYLLAAILLSLIIPLIDFDWNSADYPQTVENYFVPSTEVSAQQENTPANSTVFTTYNTLIGLYVLGCTLMFIRFITTFKNLTNLIRGSEIVKQDGVSLVYTEREVPVSSFFKYIFISKQENFAPEELESILSHEKKHISDLHSLDIVFIELLKIIWWYNPAIYLVDRSLRTIHEFICDSEAVRYTNMASYERLLINTLFKKNKLTVVSQFSEVSIKQRIEKLNQQKPHAMKKLKFLLMIPLTLALIWACDPSDVSDENLESAASKVVTGRIINTEGEPLPGVNIVVKGTSVGTVSDINENYKLNVPAGSENEIVYSFIGLDTQKVPVNGRDVIDVELTKDTSYKGSDAGMEDNSSNKIMKPSNEFISENGKYYVVGKVENEAGEPLQGINVVLVGHKIGTVTNEQGEYKVEVPEKDGKIMYAFKGYNLVMKSFTE